MGKKSSDDWDWPGEVRPTAETRKYQRNLALAQKLHTIGRCWDPNCYGKTYPRRTWQRLWAPTSKRSKRSTKYVWYRRSVRECGRCFAQYVDKQCTKWNDVEYAVACKAIAEMLPSSPVADVTDDVLKWTQEK